MFLSTRINIISRQAEGVQLSTYDGKDYFPMTQQDIQAGSPVMYVPADLTFTSSKAEQEFGGALSQCEMQLIQAGLQDKLPLFRIFFKVVSEYIKGEEVCVCLFCIFVC